MTKMRLDMLVLEKGFAESREKARAMIMAGLIFCGNQRMDKAGTMVDPTITLEVRGETCPYVSRGGLKLQKALEFFQVDVNGKICMDLGASTGGFTDCLLQQGAKLVYAIDVGYGQLDFKLRQDERVIVRERENVRYITAEQFPKTPSFAVMDLSFISLKLVLPAACLVLEEGGALICLVKPQFEAGKGEVPKSGVVKDISVHEKVLKDFILTAEEIGFAVMGVTYSPICGAKGNIEYLAYLKKDVVLDTQIDIEKIVAESHANLLQGDKM